MERRIERGCTVLTVKHVVKEIAGVYRHGEGRFRVDIQYQKKKYLIGIFDTYQDAVAARRIAERKAAAGLLPQWHTTIPHGNSPDSQLFWEAELNN